MLTSLSISTIYSSIRTIRHPIGNMFTRFSDASAKMVYTVKAPNANSTPTLSNISVIFSHPTVSKWIPRRLISLPLGPHLRKSRTYNHSSVFAISTDVSFSTIALSLFPLLGSPNRMSNGILDPTLRQCSTPWRKHSLMPLSSRTGFPTSKSSWKPMRQIMH